MIIEEKEEQDQKEIPHLHAASEGLRSQASIEDESVMMSGRI